MIIPLTIGSSTSEQLNDFFDSDLTFTQTSLNKNKNFSQIILTKLIEIFLINVNLFKVINSKL